jgi:hypothetical protein
MAGANLMESKRVKIYLGFMVDADETLWCTIYAMPLRSYPL